MATATLPTTHAGAIGVLREQIGVVRGALHRNVDDFTHEESLLSPETGGNCLNWVVGHLVHTNELALQVLGQSPTLGKEALRRYDRGSAELHNSDEAIPFTSLLQAWDDSCARIGAALETATPQRLDAPAPFSPRKNADETVLSLLTIIMFHQAYHVGQTGLLRRFAGKKGAIK